MQLHEGSSLLYMKVGTHAQEDLPDIIARKRREIEQEGISMWGYGGNTCHPTSMVQPFAAAASGPIVLCMQPINSNHRADPLRATEYSVDGTKWELMPAGIHALGSRFALCISTLEEADIKLDLAATRVAVDISRGKNGRDYLKGQVDKACLEITNRVDSVEPSLVPIKLVATIVRPYAVFLRG